MMTDGPTTASVSRETASTQNPVGGFMLRRGSVLSARYHTEESFRANEEGTVKREAEEDWGRERRR
jgi:hypothetical protein